MGKNSTVFACKRKKKEKNNPKDDDHDYVGKKQLQVQGHNSNIFKVWVLINFFMLSRESVELWVTDFFV